MPLDGGGFRRLNEQLGLLIELQRLDKKIIAFGHTIKSIPKKISAMDPPIQAAEDGLEKARARYEALEKKKRDHEQKVQELKDKAEKAKTRTADIKDNKAYHAHLKEIENIETSVFKAEDEILSLMEELEPLAQELTSAEDALKAQKAKAAEMKKTLDAEVEEAKKELELLKGERSGFVEPIEKPAFDLYMELLTNLGGQAVASIEGEICGGCDMNIMPQLCSEVKKGDKIIQCPQCKRILYFEPQPPDTAG